MKVHCAVKDLRVGDVLTPTMREIIGIRPSLAVGGHHYVTLRRVKDGTVRSAQFRSRTMVTVERTDG